MIEIPSVHSVPWAVINAILSLIDAIIIYYELYLYFRHLTFTERFGKGMIGAALILTIGPILDNGGMPYLSRAGNPFNAWPSTLLRLGIAVLFIGRILRHRRHQHNNDLGVAQAEAYFADKKPRARP